jgi:hypothetical protein
MNQRFSQGVGYNLNIPPACVSQPYSFSDKTSLIFIAAFLIRSVSVMTCGFDNDTKAGGWPFAGRPNDHWLSVPICRRRLGCFCPKMVGRGNSSL